MTEKFTASIILASASPRRKELLAEAGYKFSVVPAEIDESVFLAEGCKACEYAKKLAMAKAFLRHAPFGKLRAGKTSTLKILNPAKAPRRKEVFGHKFTRIDTNYLWPQSSQRTRRATAFIPKAAMRNVRKHADT
jgi:hypothetical protein